VLLPRPSARRNPLARLWSRSPPIPHDTAPRQITAGSAAHRYPAVVVLPGGDLVVAYETAREDIYFKRGPFERLATAAERPVAISQREMEKFPFVVRSGTRLVFFWMSADRHDPRPLWRVRVRTYTPAWTEAEASWGPAHDLSQTGTFLEEGPGPDPDAAPDQFGELVDLYLVRHHPVTGWGEPSRVIASPFSGFGPVPVLAPGGRGGSGCSGAMPIAATARVTCSSSS
jgi:hypothetical protein